MCVSGCFLLYKAGTTLETVTCPCGRGYWDVFHAAFIDGEKIRAGKAPPKKDYEAKLKRELSTTEYRARIRHQWIVHFLDCEIKRKLDNKARADGRNDGSTLRRATTELSEIARGDYDSLGLSQDSPPSSISQTHNSYSPRPLGAPISNVDQNTNAIAAGHVRPWQPISYGPLGQTTTSTTETSSVLIASPSYSTRAYDSLATSPPGVNTALATGATQARRPVIQSDRGGTTQPRGVSFFLPGEAIELAILKTYADSGVFGGPASVKPHTHQDREGYLIQGVNIKPPTAADIAELKKDTRRFISETKTRQYRSDRQSAESSESEHDAPPHAKSRNLPEPERRSRMDKFPEEAKNIGTGHERSKRYTIQTATSRTRQPSDPQQQAFEWQSKYHDDMPNSRHTITSRDQVSSQPRSGAAAVYTTASSFDYKTPSGLRRGSGTGFSPNTSPSYPDSISPYQSQDRQPAARNQAQDR